MSISSLIYPQTSTFQGILITDYSRSFAVFTYYCGDLRYSRGVLNYFHGASIGFAAPGGLFANHPAALNDSAQSISCLNEPASPWVNVVYEISAETNLSQGKHLPMFIHIDFTFTDC